MITEFFKESKVFTAEIIINDKLTFTRWTWQSLSATNSQIQKRDFFFKFEITGKRPSKWLRHDCVHCNRMYTKGVFLKGGIYGNGVDSREGGGGGERKE